VTYHIEPNFIEYDEWFDNNIDPKDLFNYKDEKKFSNEMHEKFYLLSKNNLIIGSSNKLIELN